MKTIAAGKFKAHCLSMIEEVSATREPVLITKRGRPVAKLVAADKNADNFIGRLEGIIQIVGDIESPVTPLEDWDALK
jgi:prevent-host-death family protein